MPGTELERTDPLEINPPEARKDVRRLCRHIFTDGHRCGSPALRTQNFCYYHYVHRRHADHNFDDRKRKYGFDLKCLDGLDNATAVQLALAEVAVQIASGGLDPRRARGILYALQLAGQNLRNLRSTHMAVPVADVVADQTFGHIAELEPGRTEPETLISRLIGRSKPFTSYDPPYEIPADTKDAVALMDAYRAGQNAAAKASTD